MTETEKAKALLCGECCGTCKHLIRGAIGPNGYLFVSDELYKAFICSQRLLGKNHYAIINPACQLYESADWIND